MYLENMTFVLLSCKVDNQQLSNYWHCKKYAYGCVYFVMEWKIHFLKNSYDLDNNSVLIHSNSYYGKVTSILMFYQIQYLIQMTFSQFLAIFSH